ncbi:hypothetical protein [Salinispira pacifica]|uniref:Lipoprotein n=1 Tax=Salinispira pacifica TaxID=1307761 RepID=V5WE67_9SPIO|nr:hypothetical protein [Salinispira pacifica]AHC13869.1 hypothetical protein L21SP2_0437 [Salinispira pacifica]
MVIFRRTPGSFLRFPVFLLGLFSLLTLSCTDNFNGMGGVPGYLGYIKDSRYISELEMEPDNDNSVVLKWVQPDSHMAQSSQIFPDGDEPGYLVLSFRENSLSVHRSLVFDEDLALVLDTREYNDVLGGSFEDWVRGPGNWGWGIRGVLDLGFWSWDPAADEDSSNPFVESGRRHEGQKIVPVLDGIWEEYLVELPSPDDYNEIVLAIRASRDINGVVNEYEDYDPFATPPYDDKPLVLMTNYPQGLNTALESAGLFDYMSNNGFDAQLRELIPQPRNDRIVAVLSFQSRDRGGRFHMLWYVPYEDLVDVSDAVLGDYEFHIIPGSWEQEEHRPQYIFQDGYFTVYNNPGEISSGYEPEDLMLDVYKVDGPGRRPSLGSPRLEFTRRIPYWDLFQDGVPGRDIAVTYRDPSGDWFVYNREASMLYRLAIAAGGIE